MRERKGREREREDNQIRGRQKKNWIKNETKVRKERGEKRKRRKRIKLKNVNTYFLNTKGRQSKNKLSSYHLRPFKENKVKKKDIE